MRSMLRKFIAVACACVVANAAAADDNGIHAYWQQFKQGDVNDDVWAALDASEPYLFTAELNDDVVELLWDGENSVLVLYINEYEITDLVMDMDAQNRPVFHADWLSPSIARISGFVDINGDGDIIIGWNQLGYESTRFQLSNGEITVSAAAKCKCSGNVGTVYKTCTQTDCDNPPVGCRRNGPVGSADTGYCEWRGVAVVGPTEPGDPVIIMN